MVSKGVIVAGAAGPGVAAGPAVVSGPLLGASLMMGELGLLLGVPGAVEAASVAGTAVLAEPLVTTGEGVAKGNTAKGAPEGISAPGGIGQSLGQLTYVSFTLPLALHTPSPQ